MQHFLYFVFKGKDSELKYSIIIPTLNEEKLLPKLLEQLCSCNISNRFELEIIISDGGSTDNTIKIAHSYSVKVVEHQDSNKQTIAAGRNYGANAAKGDYLIFLTADIQLKNCELFLIYWNKGSAIVIF